MVEAEVGDEDVDVSVAVRKGVIQAVSPELLKDYYRLFFPFTHMVRWLSYASPPSSDLLLRREFSFTLANDVYVRYKCFKNEEDMRKAFRDLCPHKIDIGATYTSPPSGHHTVSADSFKPVDRELVFDVDMTDYDCVRTCCKGAKACGKCWQFMTAAIKVLDAALREDFGYQQLLWVYSGRRGIHCWVCDKEARELGNEARSAIVSYLTMLKGSADNEDGGISLSYPLHPSVSRALAILLPIFERHIIGPEGQGLLVDASAWARVLAFIPASLTQLRDSIEAEWVKLSTAQERWKFFQAEVEGAIEKLASRRGPGPEGMARSALRKVVPAVVFTYGYPRLDVNVSKHINHLLKSPFCVHPATGRVCVPIVASEASSFDPELVPTLTSLFADYASRAPGPDTRPGYEGTGMAEAVSNFETFLRPLERECRVQLKREADASTAAVGDW